MGINFPASPANNQYFAAPAKYGTGPLYRYLASKNVWLKAAGTASRANKVVNPAMQISQQFGDTALVCLAGYQYYAADQWMGDFSGGLTAQISCQRLAGVTPRGSKYRLYLQVTTAQAVIGSGQFVRWRHLIEANRLSDLSWGDAVNAKWAVLYFGFRAPAGTYAVTLNGSDRKFINEFTVSAADAGWDQEYSVCIPPCTDGTWLKDNTLGLSIDFYVACTTAFAGTPGQWGSAGACGPNMSSNTLATVGNQFHVFDVALHADPLGTGVAPEFQAPGLAESMQDCLRYWYPAYRFDGVVTSATQGYGWNHHYVPMRASPAMALVGTIRCYDASTSPNIASLSNYNVSAETTSALFVASGLIIGRPFKTLVDGVLTGYVAVSARM